MESAAQLNAGQCSAGQYCNARNDEAAILTGTSTTVGVCITSVAAGAACAAGYGKNCQASWNMSLLAVCWPLKNC